jgi:DNA primase
MIDYLQLLESNGVECVPSGKDRVFICCPFHIESVPSCGVHLVTGGWNCLGCHEHGAFYKLLSKVANVDEQTATLMLRDSSNMESVIKEISGNLNMEKEKTVKRFIKVKSFNDKFSLPSESKKDFVKYLRSRGVDLIMAQTYNIRCGVEGDWFDRVIIPVVDFEGRMLGYTGRSINPKVQLRFKTLRAYEGAMVDALLGVSWFKVNVFRDQRVPYVILVEGVFDTFKLQSLDYYTIGRLGTNLLTGNQISYLLGLTNKIIIFYDGDKSGIVAAEKTKKQLEKYFQVYNISVEGKEPSDFTGKELKNLLSEVI